MGEWANETITQLSDSIAFLCESELFCDMHVRLPDDRIIPAHRIIFHARGGKWTKTQFAEFPRDGSLDWTHIDFETGQALLHWLYSGKTITTKDSDWLALIKSAWHFDLPLLVKQCESNLIRILNRSNCLSIFSTAVDVHANELKKHASQIISQHWSTFSKSDLSHLDAPLLVVLLYENTKYPLHTAIQFKRHDVIKLLLNNHKVDIHMRDEADKLPLEIALENSYLDICETLFIHGADVNAKVSNGLRHLQQSLQKGDWEAAKFLISKGANIFCVTPESHDTCLHLLCYRKKISPENCIHDSAYFEDDSNEESSAAMVEIGKLFLEKGIDCDKRNGQGYAALHVAILVRNRMMFDILTDKEDIDLNIKTTDGKPPLWFALQCSGDMGRDMAKKLIQRGARVDEICSPDGDNLIQLLICERNESDVLFLLSIHPSNIKLDHMNECGETALHLACMFGMDRVVAALLSSGASANIETIAPSKRKVPIGNSQMTYMGYRQTCLHYAVIYGNFKTVETLLSSMRADSNKQESPLDCNLHDSLGNTPLNLALTTGNQQIVELLLESGADINLRNSRGLTLLHQAILQCDSDMACFLMEHGSAINQLTKDGVSPLHLSIDHRLVRVVDELCKRGADMSILNIDGHCPLWSALVVKQSEDVASTLVRHGVDTDAWGPGPGGCYQTLLHACIDSQNEGAAVFLIRSGCDLETSRRRSPEGYGGNESRDGLTPLHLCCVHGLVNVAQALIEHGANVNAKDAEGKTPLQLAIAKNNPELIELLLRHPNVDLSARDHSGCSPFSEALRIKNHTVARGILSKLPSEAEQFDNKGLNFLQMAIQTGQVENALFLLSIGVNVNSCVRNSLQTPSLHLAVTSGNEVVVRSLLLAGAEVNAVDREKQTALHVAAANGHAVVASALLQNGIKTEMTDANGNNALHIACREGHTSVVRTLLTESSLNAETVNLKGLNPLHVLAKYGKEHAVTIFKLFVETMPEYPLDNPDVDGNTALLLAYMKGNGPLCRALVRAGACLGCMNKDGVTIFNYHVATKQLLYSLLDCLEKEPRWAEGDICLECGTKFSLTMRRHHCRHCGRLLCSKCSDQDMAILKYNLNKPVRVCGVCFDALQVGAS